MLSGGGARGAYEVGVLKALAELGVTFDLVFGTSIGAVNASFFAQGDLSRLEELWCSWRPKGLGRAWPFELCRMLMGKRWSLFQPEMLEALLYSELDLARLHGSKTQAGFVVTDLCTLTTRVIRTDEIDSMKFLVDTLMATCALPLVFPPRHLNGEGLWIDGGIVRNTPMLAALNTDAPEIYTVLLHGDNIHACPTNVLQYLLRCVDIALTASAVNGLALVAQHNRLIELGSVPSLRPIKLHIFQPAEPPHINLLDFDLQSSCRLIEQGYQETLLATSTQKAA